MQRERIAENVYYFQSDLYAQVTAGAIVGPNWAVVIDTLAMPEETIQIRDFIEQELNLPVRYVINTHYHADHSLGQLFLPQRHRDRSYPLPQQAGYPGSGILV